eukprot:gene4904-6669_t
MTDLSRREALAAAALATFAAAAPAWAQDKAAPIETAAWDLSDLYADDAAWDAARRKVLGDIPGLLAYKGTLGSSAEKLAAALVAQSDIGRTATRVYTYISLKADEDLRISANQERQAQAIDMFTAFGEATSWVSPELLTVGKAKIESFIATNATLKSRFDFYLADALRQAEHTLTPEGENPFSGTRPSLPTAFFHTTPDSFPVSSF